MQLWGKKEGFQILVFVACSCLPMLVWAACCFWTSHFHGFGQKKRKSWCWSSFAQAQEDTFSLQIFGVRAGTICSTSAGSACQSHIREGEDISWWNTETIQTNKSTLPCPVSCSPPHFSWRCVTVTLLSNSVSTAVYTDPNTGTSVLSRPIMPINHLLSRHSPPDLQVFWNLLPTKSASNKKEPSKPQLGCFEVTEIWLGRSPHLLRSNGQVERMEVQSKTKKTY